VTAEGGHHQLGGEAATQQLGVQARPRAWVEGVAFETPLDLAGQHGSLVDVLESRLDRLASEPPVDAHGLELTLHAKAAAPLYDNRGPGVGGRHPSVVDRAILLEPREHGVDLVEVERLTEALAQLRFGQLAPRQHPNGCRTRVCGFRPRSRTARGGGV